MAAYLGNSLAPRYPDEILELPMFHQITKEMAEVMVRKYCQGEGTYLLRPSGHGDTSCFSITLSVSPKADIRHLRVSIGQGQTGRRYKYSVTKTREFSTFLDFLRYYYKNPIPCEQNINVRLLRGLGYSNSTQSTSSSGATASNNQPLNVKPLDRQKSVPRDNSSRKGERKVAPKVAEIGRLSSTPGTLPSHTSSKKINQLKVRSASLNLGSDTPKNPRSPASSPMERAQSYTNFSAVAVRNLTDPRNRPPMPIPRQDEDPYPPNYFEVDPNKDFFEETYNHLKEAELCECGLRMVDSSLPLGWTIHKFEDPALGWTIFFQDENELTVWDMPLEIVPLLTDDQTQFIRGLCREIGCKVPDCMLSENLAKQAAASLSLGRTSSCSLPGSQSSSVGSQASTQSLRVSIPPAGESSQDQQAHREETPYELPSPLVVSTTSQAFPCLSQCPPSLPVVSEQPDSPQGQQQASPSHEESDGGQHSCTSQEDFSSGQSLSQGASVTSFCVPCRNRWSFNSIPAVTIRAVSGAPSAGKGTGASR